MAETIPSRNSSDSFRSAHSNVAATADSRSIHERFAPAEEAALLEESGALKTSANSLYASSAYSDAIATYDRALAACPNYLDYEVAVLKSNIAACHIKLAEWKEAVAAASAALNGLDRLDPPPKPAQKEGSAQQAESKSNTTAAPDLDAPVVELADDDTDAAATLAALQLSDERRAQVRSLRAKSLMRRARSNMALEGWGALAAAEQDYQAVLALKVVPAADERFIRQQLLVLPPRIAQAKEKEMAEMMGKLKELGNGILKPFGLSTDMFKFQQDPKTGGYNMSFGGNGAS